MAEKGARASGTPFLSFFTLPEILALARALIESFKIHDIATARVIWG
jgi:hypothetical protein